MQILKNDKKKSSFFILTSGHFLFYFKPHKKYVNKFKLMNSKYFKSNSNNTEDVSLSKKKCCFHSPLSGIAINGAG